MIPIFKILKTFWKLKLQEYKDWCKNTLSYNISMWRLCQLYSHTQQWTSRKKRYEKEENLKFIWKEHFIQWYKDSTK